MPDKNIPNKDLGSEKRLIYRNIKFTRIDFAFKNVQYNEDIRGNFRESFDIHINWKFTATRKDHQAIIISCDFKLLSENLEIKTTIQTKLEFDKKFSKEEVFNSTALQVLAARLFFPYMVELISSNTAKMGIAPIVLEYSVLDAIIKKTKEQGGFAKPE